jgi:hypothetical protein
MSPWHLLKAKLDAIQKRKVKLDPQEQISLAFLCLLFLGLFAVLAYVLITS